jgi:Ser/Thr protein kinase RdoA (MazF antagonist)
VHLPSDHPLSTDPALSPYAAGIDEIAPGATFHTTLRYLPSRRVAMAVDVPGIGAAVLKVFANPRGRGNHRRLQLLAGSPIAGLVPTPHGVDATGHVALVGFTPGTVFDQLAGYTLIDAAYAAGAALRRIHDSTVVLDRSWTIADELALLMKRATPRTAATAQWLVERSSELANEPLITAHRDCHPRQLILTSAGVQWIDLDDAAMAPAGLDVGNFVAHLRRDGALGTIERRDADQAVSQFLSGYGPLDSAIELWEQLSLTRLAALAERRHGRPQDAEVILGLLTTAAQR